MSEWISVEDRLPENVGSSVLVCGINPYNQRTVFIAFLGYGNGGWYTTDVTKMQDQPNNSVAATIKITHWQPLPGLPIEGDTQ